MRVVHRVSIPSFEYVHLPVEHADDGSLIETKATDKPWRIVDAIRKDEGVATSVLAVLTDLTNLDADEAPFEGAFEETLLASVKAWGQAHSPEDARFACE